MPMSDSGMIFITNKNGFYFEDSYDGVLYRFNPGERVVLPTVAATHIFGFGLADKTETLKRQGWALKPGTLEEDPEGLVKLRKFVPTEAMMVEREIPDHSPEKEVVKK